MSQWVILVLYGLVGSLFSYCVSLVMTSPLSAFAASAGYQVIMFIVSSKLRFKSCFQPCNQLYLIAYLVTLTYAKTSKASSIITIARELKSLASRNCIDVFQILQCHCCHRWRVWYVASRERTDRYVFTPFIIGTSFVRFC
jgi:hypothetical protein